MNKEFVPYEQALELKELGFDEPCFGSWETEYVKVPTYTHSISEFYKNSNHPIGKVAASTFSQAFRFFREKYQASPSIHCMSEQGNSWRYHIPNEGGEMNFNTYEEAELACLNKLIEIVKQKQTTPYISDNFQIGPDGAFEHEDDLKDWDNTLNDGLENE